MYAPMSSSISGIGMKGEMIIIQNVSRYCDDIYECVADNGVPPAVSRQMRVTVECEYHKSFPLHGSH